MKNLFPATPCLQKIIRPKKYFLDGWSRSQGPKIVGNQGAPPGGFLKFQFKMTKNTKNNKVVPLVQKKIFKKSRVSENRWDVDISIRNYFLGPNFRYRRRLIDTRFSFIRPLSFSKILSVFRPFPSVLGP